MTDLADSLCAQAGLLTELVGEAIAPDLRSAGLSLSQFEMLSAIRSAGGQATQAEVARRLGITPPSLCEALKPLVAAGLVEQRPSRRDKRANAVTLSLKGHAAVRKVVAAVQRTEAELGDSLEPADLDTTLRVLRQVTARLLRKIHPPTQRI